MSMKRRSKLPGGELQVSRIAHERDVGVVDGDGEVDLIVQRRGILAGRAGRRGIRGRFAREAGAHCGNQGKRGQPASGIHISAPCEKPDFALSKSALSLGTAELRLLAKAVFVIGNRAGLSPGAAAIGGRERSSVGSGHRRGIGASRRHADQIERWWRDHTLPGAAVSRDEDRALASHEPADARGWRRARDQRRFYLDVLRRPGGAAVSGVLNDSTPMMRQRTFASPDWINTGASITFSARASRAAALRAAPKAERSGARSPTGVTRGGGAPACPWAGGVTAASSGSLRASGAAGFSCFTLASAAAI